MKEMVAIRPKIYNYPIDDMTRKQVNTILRYQTRGKFKDYKERLENKKTIIKSQKRFTMYLHKISTRFHSVQLIINEYKRLMEQQHIPMVIGVKQNLWNTPK